MVISFDIDYSKCYKSSLVNAIAVTELDMAKSVASWRVLFVVEIPALPTARIRKNSLKKRRGKRLTRRIERKIFSKRGLATVGSSPLRPRKRRTRKRGGKPLLQRSEKFEPNLNLVFFWFF